MIISPSDFISLKLITAKYTDRQIALNSIYTHYHSLLKQKSHHMHVTRAGSYTRGLCTRQDRNSFSALLIFPVSMSKSWWYTSILFISSINSGKLQKLLCFLVFPLVCYNFSVTEYREEGLKASQALLPPTPLNRPQGGSFSSPSRWPRNSHDHKPVRFHIA